MKVDSLADRLQMPMSGAAQGGKKSVDDELDAQFGAKKDGDESSSKKGTSFDKKTPLGEATVDELQAALDAAKAKQGKKTPEETGEDEAHEDEGGDADDDEEDDGEESHY